MRYQELIDAARAYADRNDIEVDANIDIFILMAEARINRALKVAQQTHRMYTNTIEGKEFYTLPADYNGMRVVHFNTGNVDAVGSATVQMFYVTPEQIAEYQQFGEANQYYYTLINNQIQVHDTLPGKGTIEMVFYRKVPPLTQKDDVNWLSEDSPDIYVSGICAEIELFVKNYDSAQLWDARMGRAIQELGDNDSQNRWAGNSMVIRRA
jgi:hypothetical protein